MIRCRFVSVASFVILIGLASHAQTYIFGRADFAAGNAPNAMVTADFNGDGIPDLAVTSTYDNTISVFLGQRTGGFAPQVTYATGPLPIAIVAGDFNGDGNLDLAVANGNCVDIGFDQYVLQCNPSSISILLGNGDGTFQPQVSYSVGTFPASIVIADFNGDGKLDLAVLNAFDNNIGILLGNGDGTFQSQVTYSVEVNTSFPVLPSLVLGDFNGDGNVDLAVPGSNAVFTLLGNGNGTFQSALSSACSPNCGTGMAVGDFNGDGKLDLAVTGGYVTTVLLGYGNGTFYLNATYANTGGPDVAVADLNGDGKLDLVIPQSNLSSGSFAVQLGNGDGTFGTPAFYGTGPIPMGIILGDFNGDGKLDVAVADAVCEIPCDAKPSLPGAVSVALGLGDGTFVASTTYSVGATSELVGSILSADFLDNGNLDIAAGLSNAVGVLVGNGNGTFQSPTSFPTAPTPSAIATGDLRNNGDLDLVSANNPCISSTGCTPGTVSVLLGNGDGAFQTHVDYPAGLAPSGVALASFRNNGTLDIAVTNAQSNSISILLGNGDGTFQPQVVYSAGTYPQEIAVGDFNKDGYPDLAIANQNGVSVLLGNGDGTFKSAVSYGVGCSGIITADFNGDGNLDLALAPSSGYVLILLGNGDGTFQAPLTTSIFGSSLATADFNGDGKLDLASVAPFTDDALLALGNGDGTFQVPTAYLVTPLTAAGLTVGDFNGDGVPDWASISPSVLGVMLSTPFASIAPGSLTFSSEGVGTASLPQTITLSNPSNVQFSVAGIAASGNFAQTSNCGASLVIGANCTITVTFTPTATGPQSGAITITDSTRISPVSVPLSGNGVSGSYLTPYPAHQNFSPQAVGASSSSATIQLVNTGNASLSITSISITGANSSDFSQTNNCGSSLPASGSCAASVIFTPQSPGSRIAMLSIADSATGSPQNANLTGTGLGAAAGLSSTSLTFVSQVVGTTSSAQSITLTTTGNAALNISGVKASQNFDETNTCSTSLATGSSCQISVTFSPSATGNLAGSITISDNAPGNPQIIALSGVATAAPNFSVAPASGSASSQTISAGQTANFSLVLAPAGSFSGTVNLSCSISPVKSPAPSCSLSGSSVNLSGGASKTVTVTIATTGSSASVNSFFDFPNWTPLAFVGFFFGALLYFLRDRKRLQVLSAPAVLLLFAFWLGCGGSSSSAPPPQTGTPPGTYTATVTATSGGTISATPLTIIVQ